MLGLRHGLERAHGDIARMKTLFLIAAGMFCGATDGRQKT
jgi:hypothetical protein